MGVFSYYALHTLKNQLKKLFKSWVLIFILACILIGVIIGVFAASVEEKAGELAGDPEITDPDGTEDTEDEPDGFEEFLSENGLAKNDIIELAAGGLILSLLVFFSMNADKNGSRIFTPADVNLLFSSPMKPQSVLMFRILTRLGAMAAASIYMLFQLPNLILNLGLSTFAALSVLIAWFLTITVCSLLQVFLYIFASSHPKVRENLRRVIYGLLLLTAGGYLLTLKNSGGSYLRAAVLFFCGRYSRYVPFWGWLKGVCMYAIEGNAIGSILCIAATVLACVLLILLTWHMKADFYEDAMAKSEETAALLERAHREKNTGASVRRKKDRSTQVLRDGMRHGAGANVYFFKSLYNRFRFAHLHFFTKTMETYLAAAVIVSLIIRFAAKTNNVIPLVLVIAGLSFFRALGNPLEQDTQTDFFLLIPESTWAKMFWSLAGGTANCFLDSLPALLVGALILGANPLSALVWIPFILSIDFYASSTGAFIALSTPASAGATLKQIVQVMFVYFGLLPDVLLMVIGLVFGNIALFSVLSALINLGLGFLFFGLTPLFIDPPQGKPAARAEQHTADTVRGKKTFSRIGASLFLILALSAALQVLASALLSAYLPGWENDPWGIMLCTFIPMYAFSIPAGLCILRKMPKDAPSKHSLTAGGFISAGFITVFMMYAGNLFGILVTSLLGKLVGTPPQNAVISYAMQENILPKLLFMVIAAPCIEELLFRKLLIDRTRIWGERTAVVVSAVLFGLFHGNLSQMFYAAALGLVFGYIYLKTGKLRYTIILHAAVNFLGSIVGPYILGQLDLTGISSGNPMLLLQSRSFLIFIGYVFIMVAIALTGLVLFFIRLRSVHFETAPSELPSGTRFRTVFCNPGMLLFVLGCLALVVLSFLSTAL